MQPDGNRIVAALGGKWRSRQGMCRCPAHDDRSPSLHVTEARHGAVLVKCFAGCEQSSVIHALRDLGLWPEREERGDPNAPSKRVVPLVRPEGPDEDERRRADLARGIWTEARAVWGSVAETYLRRRAIAVDLPPTLRFHPTLRHGVSGKQFPALVAAVQDGAGRVCAVQRTYLREDGNSKAAVSPAKATLGPMLDGAVRLSRPSRILGLAEGVETALSARQIFSLPVWATLGASRMHAVRLPAEVEHVVIFADAGGPGLAAAERAAAVYRQSGLEANIEAPAEGDWNDALNSPLRGAA